jgi:hypothetical protein
MPLHRQFGPVRFGAIADSVRRRQIIITGLEDF